MEKYFKLKSLKIHGINADITGIKEVLPPEMDRYYWEIFQRDGTKLIITGDVVAIMESVPSKLGDASFDA